jgi:hypothetical protein
VGSIRSIRRARYLGQSVAREGRNADVVVTDQNTHSVGLNRYAMFTDGNGKWLQGTKYPRAVINCYACQEENDTFNWFQLETQLETT